MENGPILKKVRRPINRRMPVSPNEQPFDNKVSESGVENKNDINIPQVENKAPAPEPAPAPAPRISLPSVERAPVQGRQENFDYNEPQYADNEYYDEYAPAQHNGVSTTVLIVSVLVCLAMGLIIGRFLFSENQTTHSGLQGVVVNNEVPRGRARCGVADRSQGCVLYIMNPQRQNVKAKDFYDMAAQVTGRQRFMIETGNMRYANTEIRPGDIAQLNIPPL